MKKALFLKRGAGLIAGIIVGCSAFAQSTTQALVTRQINSVEAMLHKYYLANGQEGVTALAPAWENLAPLHFYTPHPNMTVQVKSSANWVALCHEVNFADLNFFEAIDSFKQKGYVQTQSDCFTVKPYAQAMNKSSTAYFLKYFDTSTFVVPTYLPFELTGDFSLKSKAPSIQVSKKEGPKSISFTAPASSKYSIYCADSGSSTSPDYAITQLICQELTPTEQTNAAVEISTELVVSDLTIPANIGNIVSTCGALSAGSSCSVTITPIITAKSPEFFPLKGSVAKKLTGNYLTYTAEIVLQSKKLLIGLLLTP